MEGFGYKSHPRRHDMGDEDDHKGDIYDALVNAANPLTGANPVVDAQSLQEAVPITVLTRGLPDGTVGDYVEIGDYTISHGNHALIISIVGPSTNQQARHYLIPARANATGGAWRRARPITEGGSGGASDFILAVKGDATKIYLRLWRSVAGAGPTQTFSIKILDMGDAGEVFTPNTDTGNALITSTYLIDTMNAASRIHNDSSIAGATVKDALEVKPVIQLPVSPGGAAGIAGAQTRYLAYHGDYAAEADAQLRLTAGAIKAINLYISANTLSTSSTLTVRKNGVATGITGTINGGQTGWVRFTGSESVVDSDLASAEIVLGGTGGEQITLKGGFLEIEA